MDKQRVEIANAMISTKLKLVEDKEGIMTKEELVDKLIEKVKEYQTGKQEDGIYEYIVTLQNIKFEVGLSDNQIRAAAEIAIAMVEELKKLPEAGFDKKKFSEIQNRFDATDDILKKTMIMAEIQTDDIKELVKAASETVLVGGAYFMFISFPSITNALYVVYEALIDHMEEEDYITSSIYFLLRSIMRMRGQEISD